MNSIDFRLQTVWRRQAGHSAPQPRFRLLAAMRTTLVGYDWITFSPADHARFAADARADEKIIECVYDPQWTTVIYNPDDKAEPTWNDPVRRPWPHAGARWPVGRRALRHLAPSRPPPPSPSPSPPQRERKGGWKFERIREDKRLPNDIKIVQSIERSVVDGIDHDELLKALELPPMPSAPAAAPAQPLIYTS